MALFSYKRISTFRNVAAIFLRNASNDTKLFWAVDKINKRTERLNDAFVDKQLEIRRDNAMTDPKDKRLLTDVQGWIYTKEASKKVQDEIRKLTYERVELNPHIVQKEDLPENLSFEYLGDDGRIMTISHYEVHNAFRGFVFEDPTPEDEQEQE